LDFNSNMVFEGLLCEPVPVRATETGYLRWSKSKWVLLVNTNILIRAVLLMPLPSCRRSSSGEIFRPLWSRPRCLEFPGNKQHVGRFHIPRRGIGTCVDWNSAIQFSLVIVSLLSGNHPFQNYRSSLLSPSCKQHSPRHRNKR